MKETFPMAQLYQPIKTEKFEVYQHAKKTTTSSFTALLRFYKYFVNLLFLVVWA